MISSSFWKTYRMSESRWYTYPLSGYTDAATARSLAVGVLYPMQWRSVLGAAMGEYLPVIAHGEMPVELLYVYDLQYVYPLYYGLATYPWRALLRDGEIIRAGTIYRIDEDDMLIIEDAGPVSVRTIEDAAWTRIGEYLNRSFVMYGRWSADLRGEGQHAQDAVEVFNTLGEFGVYRWNREILDLYYAFWEWAGGEWITNRVTRIKDLHKEGMN